MFNISIKKNQMNLKKITEYFTIITYIILKIFLKLSIIFIIYLLVGPIVFKLLMIIIGVLISTAYLTLMERKILALTQNRKGPSLVGVMGILQPIADGIKLFSKELIIPTNSSKWVFLIAPIICLTSALIL